MSISSVNKNENVIVVLGNEGSGIRTNVLNRCDTIVYLSSITRSLGSSAELNTNVESDIDMVVAGIDDKEVVVEDGADDDYDDDDAVDSLNVSVAGGIILHHFLGTN